MKLYLYEGEVYKVKNIDFDFLEIKTDKIIRLNKVELIRVPNFTEPNKLNLLIINYYKIYDKKLVDVELKYDEFSELVVQKTKRVLSEVFYVKKSFEVKLVKEKEFEKFYCYKIINFTSEPYWVESSYKTINYKEHTLINKKEIIIRIRTENIFYDFDLRIF